MNVIIRCPALDELAARMAAFGGDLSAELMNANEAIRVETLWTIEGLYPQGTLYAWQSNINTVPGATASVEIKTDDPILYWYEYGTKPHEIDANEQGALAFEGTNAFAGQFVVVSHVEHPGEQAHPNADRVLIQMGVVARAEWTTAIQELLLANF